MNYFRLGSHCYFVKGLRNSCIYNVISGDMVSIDDEKSRIIEECEKNININDIQNIDYCFLEKLNEMNFGDFFENPVYIDKLSIGGNESFENILPQNYSIKKLFVELTNKCNFNCLFCSEVDSRVFRKTGCKKWASKGKSIDLDMWKDVIYQVKKIGCNHIAFIGGEPLLNIDSLEELAKYVKEIGIEELSLYTNGSVIDSQIINILKQYNIRLIIQILGATELSYHKISGRKGMCEIVYNNINLINSEGIDFDILFLVNKHNEDEVNKVVEIVTKFNSKFILDFIYPKPNNEFFSPKYFSLTYDKKKCFSKVYINNFCSNEKYHNCFGYQLAVTMCGDILPCIMTRKLVLGNIRSNTIVDVLSTKKSKNLKKLTKDKIEGCKNCSYRYGCFDCRALEMSASKKINGIEFCNILPSEKKG